MATTLLLRGSLFALIADRRLSHAHFSAVSMGRQLYSCRPLLAIAVMLIGAHASPASAAEPPSLAILANQSVAEASDLTFVALSELDQVSLVERERVAEALREQKLVSAGLTIADSLRMGTILKADGLLFLNRETVKEQQVVDRPFRGCRSGRDFLVAATSMATANIASTATIRSVFINAELAC